MDKVAIIQITMDASVRDIWVNISSLTIGLAITENQKQKKRKKDETQPQTKKQPQSMPQGSSSCMQRNTFAQGSK
ncbi:unnamed protein product [Fusarium graminearum]|uniref:Chromosome 1, complete genome n=2 Tax=Gibberella zeae TaxID=5518 RepID=A0A098D6N7_GIBZE|nr:unnamed protein product [Fusarium graminearum]CAF3607584.1 unnamed protein product [Fusarium graminearum]CAF3632024.1 unnamed protein product [Fusarium graminearum]CAG1969005.1 unnamed protein product [Fusarium graminearum]CAG1975879.1 unnamed protein product [Fusarium graminearum]